jgi:hypothetical protein
MIKEFIRRIVKWSMSEPIVSDVVCSDSRYSNGIGSKSISSGRFGSIEECNRGMNFTVYNATGGKVVQLFDYDMVKDRANSSLYIIADKEDLGEELGMIITRECLSR